MRKLAVIPLVFVLVFIVAGFGFGSETARTVAEIIWIVLLVILLLIISGFGIAVLIWAWNRARKENLIYPDENGNLPIQISKNGYFVNLNLTGSDTPAWAVWQVTNNRSGSQPRELVSHMIDGQARPVRIPTEIISDDDATPLLLEARSIAQDL